MTISFTGVAYLLGFFALALLTYRFFQYWQREKTTVSKLFFYFVATFTLFMIITAIGGLFFAENNFILRIVVILATFFQSLGFAVVAYLIFYLKLPKISPWWGCGGIFLLGLITTVLTIIIPFRPHLEVSGGINWDIQPLVDIFRLFLFLITFLPLGLILFQQFKTSKNPLIKTKAFGIGLILMFGVLVGLFDFFLENIFKLGALSSDMAVAALSIIVLVVVLLTQKPPSLKEQEKEYVSSSPPQISW